MGKTRNGRGIAGSDLVKKVTKVVISGKPETVIAFYGKPHRAG